MSASTTDYFQKLGGSSSLVNTPKVTATRSAAGTTLTVDNCNWDQTTGKIFATYQVDTSGAVVSGTEIIWTGVVNSTTSIGSLTRLAGASDSGSAIGDYVELLPASLWGNKLVSGLLVEHNQDGTHTMVSPKITTSIKDTNGNEEVKFTATASAVNEVTVTNAATGNAPQISATGDDTNIPLKLASKGTSPIQMFVNGVDQLGATQSWTPTITGYSSNPTGGVYQYSQVGKIVQLFVSEPNTGTSNALTITLTLPVTARTLSNMEWHGTASVVDSGANQSTPGMMLIASGGTVVTIYKDFSASSFTASGAKRIRRGTITYEAA